MNEKGKFACFLEGVGNFILFFLVYAVLRKVISWLPFINFTPINAPAFALWATTVLAKKIGARVPFIVFCFIIFIDTILLIIFAIIEHQYTLLAWNIVFTMSVAYVTHTSFIDFDSFG